jgi:hypothetical protein
MTEFWDPTGRDYQRDSFATSSIQARPGQQAEISGIQQVHEVTRHGDSLPYPEARSPEYQSQG